MVVFPTPPLGTGQLTDIINRSIYFRSSASGSGIKRWCNPEFKKPTGNEGIWVMVIGKEKDLKIYLETNPHTPGMLPKKD